MEYRRFRGTKFVYENGNQLRTLKGALQTLNAHVAGIFCASRVWGQGLDARLEMTSEYGKKPIHIKVQPTKRNIDEVVLQGQRYFVPDKKRNRATARLGDYVFDIRYRH